MAGCGDHTINSARYPHHLVQVPHFAGDLENLVLHLKNCGPLLVIVVGVEPLKDLHVLDHALLRDSVHERRAALNIPRTSHPVSHLPVLLPLHAKASLPF